MLSTCLLFAVFITTPSTATVVIGLHPPNSNYNHSYVGQFQCVTRVGFKLVWVINGISADNIRGTPGFEQVAYELIPVQDSGNTLSILDIPATTTQLNGTIVTCTAVYNQSIEAHSQPVYLIVTAKGEPADSYMYADHVNTMNQVWVASMLMQSPKLTFKVSWTKAMMFYKQ